MGIGYLGSKHGKGVAIDRMRPVYFLPTRLTYINLTVRQAHGDAESLTEIAIQGVCTPEDAFAEITVLVGQLRVAIGASMQTGMEQQLT